jgi:hypothetical protein
LRKSRKEWLIVARWGAQGEYLTIGLTHSTPDATSAAPVGLTPRRTFLGIRVSGADPGDDGPFLLANSLPLDIPVAGTFIPAQGYIRLLGPPRDPCLTAWLVSPGASGCPGTQSQAHQPGIRAVPPGGLAYFIEARRRYWPGEFLESGVTPLSAPRAIHPPPAVTRARSHAA